jgi:hypothetical protein
MRRPGYNVELTTYTNVFSGSFWYLAILSVVIILASLALQLRIYHRRWIYKTGRTFTKLVLSNVSTPVSKSCL